MKSGNYSFKKEPFRNIIAENGIRFDGHSRGMVGMVGGWGHAARQQTFKSLQNGLYVPGNTMLTGNMETELLSGGKTMNVVHIAMKRDVRNTRQRTRARAHTHNNFVINKEMTYVIRTAKLQQLMRMKMGTCWKPLRISIK